MDHACFTNSNPGWWLTDHLTHENWVTGLAAARTNKGVCPSDCPAGCPTALPLNCPGARLMNLAGLACTTTGRTGVFGNAFSDFQVILLPPRRRSVKSTFCRGLCLHNFPGFMATTLNQRCCETIYSPGQQGECDTLHSLLCTEYHSFKGALRFPMVAIVSKNLGRTEDTDLS